MAFDDRKEDEWEKLSRISRRTAQNKKPVNLDTIEDKIKTLHTLQIDMGRHKPLGNLAFKAENDKDRTHSTFLDQKVPLSERNQGETDSASASVKAQKQVSIFFDFQNQHINNREDMIKFFEEHQEKKRRTVELSHKIKASQEVNALLDKDYNTKVSPRKRQNEATKVTTLTLETAPVEAQPLKKSNSKELSQDDRKLAEKLSTETPSKVKTPLPEKAGRGVSLNSMSTSKGTSVVSTAKPSTVQFGASKTLQSSRTSQVAKAGTAARR